MAIKGIQIGKEEVKLSLFADNMIVYISDPKNYQVMLMDDNHLQQCSGYKINSKMSVDLLYTDDISNEKEIRQTSPFTISTSNIKYLEVALTKKVKDLYSKNFET